MDDWNPEALPTAVTDPDEREATRAGQEQFRREREEHVARVEEHRGTPDADPARQGAFEQKPDIQQQQIELWAYKALSYFDGAGEGGTWEQFVRVHELPDVWANTLVKPRFEELRSRRHVVDRAEVSPGNSALLEERGLFESTEEVQLEGAAGHIDLGPVPSEQAIADREPPPDPPPADERGPSGNEFQVGRDTIDAANRTRAAEALGAYLERVTAGEIVPDAAVIDRLEKLAG